jgi:quercetin dioxygenase-like cupin family protein
MIRADSFSALARRAVLSGVVLLALVPLALTACHGGPPEIIQTLMSKPLPDMPGKEGEMILVEYGPGASDPVHRHHAHAFVYVLEGSVVMQVQGGEEVTLTPGQTFYEGPDDIHVVGRNASSTRSAKFLVFLVKDEGAPLIMTEHAHPEPRNAATR